MAGWQLDFERRGMDLMQTMIGRIEKPKDGKDGADGKDGRDAFELDQFAMTLSDDQLEYVWTFGAGETRKEFRFPRPSYREVFKAGETYRAGDSVTWGGSSWIAMRETTAKPETDDSWRLAVKRGRDGKDGKNGEKGERGAAGRDLRVSI
jgi:integrin beta 3